VCLSTQTQTKTVTVVACVILQCIPCFYECRWSDAPINIEIWALPLFKSVGLVFKSSNTIARSQNKCASCEICSYHLGLESSDLSPPFKDMYICDVCNRTYHWQCLLKTSCCNATEREAIDANDSWACPACINLNQNEKESCIHFQKREIVEVSWNPT